MRYVLTLNAGSSSLKFGLFGLMGMQQNRMLGGHIQASGDVMSLHVGEGVGKTVANRQLVSKGN